MKPEYIEQFMDNIDTLAYPQWGVADTPMRSPFYNNMKVYSELYPKISEMSNSEIQFHLPVNKTSEDTKTWLEENGKLELSNLQGIEFDLYHVGWNKALNMLHASVYACSTKDYAYIVEKDFVFQYDTTYIEAYGIKNGAIRSSRMKGNPWERNDRLPEATLPEGYEIISEDISANTFKIQIKAKSLDKLGQLTPKGQNLHNGVNSLLSLRFDIKDNVLMDTFELRLINDDPFNNAGKYYDPITNEAKDFSYQRTYTPIVKRRLDKANPVVDKVTPSKYSVGDTISISGKNLSNFKDKVYCTCAVVEEDIEFLRFCKIPDDNIIFDSYHEIKFVMPSFFDFNDGWT